MGPVDRAHASVLKGPVVLCSVVLTPGSLVTELEGPKLHLQRERKIERLVFLVPLKPLFVIFSK